MRYRLLLVDDDPLSLFAVQTYLSEKGGYQVDAVQTSEAAFQSLKNSPLETALVILDYKLGPEDGAQVAQRLLSAFPKTYILMYSGDGSRQAVKSSWEAGAVGFIEKDGNLEKLASTVKNWCTKYEQTYLAASLSSSVAPLLISSLGLIGRSRALSQVADKIQRYADKKETVLILGETGTGKERVARALHRADAARFFAVNCAAYNGSSDLLESDLFGHTKGSFTGANRDHKGIFESAEGGTVFLDEVHTLDLKAQQKLLRALQEKTVRPVGATREYKVQFRLVAAAKSELLSLVDSGQFLADLYERLNVLPITVPPLRERKEDIEPLTAYFCHRYTTETGEKKRFLSRTVRYLENYAWPRNVRELENLVKRLCIDSRDEEIGPEHLDARFFESPVDTGPTPAGAQPVRTQMDLLLKTQILQALRESTSQREAARKLGMPESSLRRLLKRMEVPASHP